MRAALLAVAMAATGILIVGFTPDGKSDQAATYRGRTAQQWYQRAALRRDQRDDLQQRLARRVRQVHRLEQAQQAKLAAVGGHWLERDFLCIYSHENGGYGWSANTGNGYYGGLQMDAEFESRYGPEFVRAWGTADHWPQSVQIAVSMRAYLSGRGFGPWPNTSRMCGLR